MNKSLRFRILARDNFTCRYCGAAAPDVRLEVDHIVPKSRGGRDIAVNLVTACFPCNSGKRDILLDAELVALVTPGDLPPKERKPRPAKSRRYVRTKRKQKKLPIPVSVGVPYIGPDVPAQRWTCAICGFPNELEGDQCSCARPRPRAQYCDSCRDSIHEDEYEEYDGHCESCHEERYWLCRECFAEPREEGEDYCEDCKGEGAA